MLSDHCCYGRISGCSDQSPQPTIWGWLVSSVPPCAQFVCVVYHTGLVCLCCWKRRILKLAYDVIWTSQIFFFLWKLSKRKKMRSFHRGVGFITCIKIQLVAILLPYCCVYYAPHCFNLYVVLFILYFIPFYSVCCALHSVFHSNFSNCHFQIGLAYGWSFFKKSQLVVFDLPPPG